MSVPGEEVLLVAEVLENRATLVSVRLPEEVILAKYVRLPDLVLLDRILGVPVEPGKCIGLPVPVLCDSVLVPLEKTTECSTVLGECIGLPVFVLYENRESLPELPTVCAWVPIEVVFEACVAFPNPVELVNLLKLPMVLALEEAAGMTL